MDVDEGVHVEEALARRAPAHGADRDLAWFLALGALRRRGHVDAALQPHLSRPLGGLDPEVRATLRIGAFEKLFARTQPHAVVHQAVEVARVLKLGRASGFINAVLRRVTPFDDGVLDATVDHPLWLVQRWAERYGKPATSAWCAANSEPPPLFVVARHESVPLEAVPVDWKGAPVPGVFRLSKGPGAPIPTLPGFAEGQWWVQDLASVLVADLIGAQSGVRVLDACAAPGGKAFRMASQGAAVVAVDRDAERLARVRQGAGRLALAVTCRQHDWTRGPLHFEGLTEPFDAVLVDAPCTALGTLRRHPDVRWRRQPDDLRRAAEVQDRILAQAATHVASGGVLVYAVCSPEPEEGPDRVASFLEGHPGFSVEHTLTTAPPTQGEDAHFAVRMRNVATPEIPE